MQREEIKYFTQNILKKRLELLVRNKWQDRGGIVIAMEEQDRIRKRLSRRLKGEEGTKIIRKMRESQ